MGACLFAAGVVSAASIEGISVTMTGSGANGTRIYVGITPNNAACLNGGVYFTAPQELNKVLAVAVAAKLTGTKVRIDCAVVNGVCPGYAIYSQ